MVNATILGNTAKVSGMTPDAGILCLEEANNNGNSVQGMGFATGNDFNVSQRFATTMRLRGYTGGSTNTGAVQTYLQTTESNMAVNNVWLILANSSPGGGIVNTPGGAQCTQPSVPTLQ
jgi:hypothetical protein